jgi:hypothetical protein
MFDLANGTILSLSDRRTDGIALAEWKRAGLFSAAHAALRLVRTSIPAAETEYER